MSHEKKTKMSLWLANPLILFLPLWVFLSFSLSLPSFSRHRGVVESLSFFWGGGGSSRERRQGPLFPLPSPRAPCCIPGAGHDAQTSRRGGAPPHPHSGFPGALGDHRIYSHNTNHYNNINNNHRNNNNNNSETRWSVASSPGCVRVQTL